MTSVTVFKFVSQNVDLKPTARWAAGLSSFHDDRRPSFGFYEKGNHWHCFGGCGGGSVIEVYMNGKECDFTAAVAELAGMLL
jgi:DNA primase